MGIFNAFKKERTKEENFIYEEVKQEKKVKTELISETNNLNLFGKLLITKTRDMSINNMKKRINGTMKGDTSQRIQEKLIGFTEEQIKSLEYIVAQTVDDTLHNFLWMVEENDEIALNYNGQNLKEISDGLCGELYSEDGWIEKYTSNKQ